MDDDVIPTIEETLSLLARRAGLPRVHSHMNQKAGTSLDWYAYIALYWINANGPLRLTDLARHFGVVPSTVCRHVQQLERDGLVDKKTDPADGRAVLLSPSDKGRVILSDLRDARQGALSESLSTWNPKDLRTLATLMVRLRDDLAHWGADRAESAASA